jgi:ABC-type branched-subunit amino acid transport system permease subunit
MSAAAAERKAVFEARVPANVFEVLVLYAVIAQGILGFVLGDPTNRHRSLGFVLSGLLTIALVLIVDLDRPRGGAIRVSQQPMLDLRASLQARPEEELR